MGSVQSARGAQPGRRRAVRSGAVRRPPPAASAARRRGRPPAPGRHPSVAERRDRPRIGAGRPRAKVPRPRGRALQRPGAGGGPGPLRRHGHGHQPGGLPPPAPSPARGAEGESAPYAAPPVRRAARGPRRTSATHPTRLETRTKESNARASRRESRATPRGAVKAEAGPGGRLRRDLPPGGGRTAGPSCPAPSGRWSESARDGTRKMVNYARAGRSQRKLWWRPAAVLTCKSVVRPGYRGERLIEPSSSWFPPKFPSG